MKIICSYLGGSHSYGLNTPASDRDERGVYVDTDIASIIGLDKNEMKQNQNTQEDKVYIEFRNALRLLRSGNTQMIEALYNNKWELLDPIWAKVRHHRVSLVSSTKLFNVLRGYMQSELRLANGERTGKLGGKRKEAVDTYGFSPKNFIQLIRLAWAGTVYFGEGFFPVNVMEINVIIGEKLLDIKTRPQFYTKEELNAFAARWEELLVNAYDNRNFNTEFDENLANELCYEVYKPLLDSHKIV